MTISTYPHYETVESLAKQLETSKEGLSAATAEANLLRYGLNKIQENKHNLFILFLLQFKSPLVYVLVAAAVLSLFLGNIHEGVLIFIIILVNSLIGFLQEIKALTSIKALQKLTESKTQVKRNNKTLLISSTELVPGDVIILSEGDIVPADIRLFNTMGLIIDESILTGESMPVEKEANLTLPLETLPYEMVNMALSGTTVTKGKAEGFVVFTGSKTYLASIAGKAEEASPDTPLSKALDILLKNICLFYYL